MTELVELCPGNFALLREMLESWRALDEKSLPEILARCVDADFAQCKEALRVSRVGEQSVPCRSLFGLDTDTGRFVGAVFLRHPLSGIFAYSYGNIGGAVRPGLRGCGVGTQMVRLAVQECAHLGLAELLLCCESKNLASARLIERLGGRFECEVLDGDIPVRRYRLRTDNCNA